MDSMKWIGLTDLTVLTNIGDLRELNELTEVNNVRGLIRHEVAITRNRGPPAVCLLMNLFSVYSSITLGFLHLQSVVEAVGIIEVCYYIDFTHIDEHYSERRRMVTYGRVL